jgi:hypothetical protein
MPLSAEYHHVKLQCFLGMGASYNLAPSMKVFLYRVRHFIISSASRSCSTSISFWLLCFCYLLFEPVTTVYVVILYAVHVGGSIAAWASARITFAFSVLGTSRTMSKDGTPTMTKISVIAMAKRLPI